MDLISKSSRRGHTGRVLASPILKPRVIETGGVPTLPRRLDPGAKSAGARPEAAQIAVEEFSHATFEFMGICIEQPGVAGILHQVQTLGFARGVVEAQRILHLNRVILHSVDEEYGARRKPDDVLDRTDLLDAHAGHSLA